MKTEDAEYLIKLINRDGFDSTFYRDTEFEEIKNDRFQDLRKKYLNARQALHWYIQTSLPNCGVPEGIDIEEEMIKAYRASMKEDCKADDLAMFKKMEELANNENICTCGYYDGQVEGTYDVKSNRVLLIHASTCPCRKQK